MADQIQDLVEQDIQDEQEADDYLYGPMQRVMPNGEVAYYFHYDYRPEQAWRQANRRPRRGPTGHRRQVAPSDTLNQ